MPHTVRKRGNRWLIVNQATGRIVGHSTSRRKAQASARIRDQAHGGRRR